MQTDFAASAKFELIKIQYHYDLGDLQEAQRALLRRWWRGMRVKTLVVFVVNAILIFYLMQVDRESFLVPFFLGALLVIATLVIGAWIKARKPAKNVWTANPILKERFNTEIDEQGIRSRCSLATSDRNWAVFTGYFETAKLFHIQQGPSQFLWIPKRAFASEQEIQRLRELLRAKLIALKF